MSDPTPTLDLTPTPGRAPAASGESEATYYFAGRAAQTTTTTGGASTTTSEIGVVGGVRYTSSDTNGNGTADRTLDASAFAVQGLEARYGIRIEGRQELTDSLNAFARVETGNRGTEGVVGLSLSLGGGSRSRLPTDPTEATARALDRELRDVYRDPGAVRERLDALDNGNHPQGLTFGEIAGRLYMPDRAGLVTPDGLTEKGARESERFDTLVAYANHRQAQLDPMGQGPRGGDFARLVQDKERILSGFQAAYGDGWQKPYGDFTAALRTGGIDRAVAGLPDGDPAATDRLRGAVVAQNQIEAQAPERFPDGLVTGAREQAEINQFRRDAAATAPAVPDRETPDREAPDRSTPVYGPVR